MPYPKEDVFKDIRDWMTASAHHQCQNKSLTSVNEQGGTRWDSFATFQCQCGATFKITVDTLSVTKRPMRKYITTTEDRIETARRLTLEPDTTLQEMKVSGGWDQVNPQAARALMMAGAFGPPGKEVGFHRRHRVNCNS